jgi:hypothetical protein
MKNIQYSWEKFLFLKEFFHHILFIFKIKKLNFQVVERLAFRSRSDIVEKGWLAIHKNVKLRILDIHIFGR